MSFPELRILMTYETFLEGKMSSIHVRRLSFLFLTDSHHKQMHAFTRIAGVAQSVW